MNDVVQPPEIRRGAGPSRGRRRAEPARGDPDLQLSLTPETRLLLATAATSPDRGRLEELLRSGIDWSRMAGLLTRERAVLPFWRRVRPLASHLDPDVRGGLERLAAVAEMRLGRTRSRLLESLDALEDAGVQAVLLKGAALAHTLYPDWRERPMSDLDLLVDPDEARTAFEALRSAGWILDDDRYPREMYRRHYHLPPLRDSGASGAYLEIHTGLLLPGHPFRLDPGEVRRRAVPAVVEGRTVRVPDVVDHLVYVCLHFAWGHMLASGAWRTIRDVRVLSGAGGFGWRDFRRRVRDARAGPLAYWTLRLARRLGGVDVPPELQDEIAPPLPGIALRALERHVTSQLFLTEPGCPSVRLSQALWVLATRPRGGRPEGVRPWAYSADFRVHAATGHTDPAETPDWSKVRRHILQRRRWWDYLSRVVAGGAES